MKYRVLVFDPKTDEFLVDLPFSTKKGAYQCFSEQCMNYDSRYIISILKE